jgi:Calcineurin-like phosphoesterase
MRILIPLLLLLVGTCAETLSAQEVAGTPAQASVPYVIMAPEGGAVARVMTMAACPFITIDGVAEAMKLRAAAGTEPQRPSLSDATDTKPSAFLLNVCETAIVQGTKQAEIAGVALPLPKALVQRIVVIGDTGCRLKKADNAWQACNDPQAYPFARIAKAAAAWKPDLIIHVGDYHYRENECPKSVTGCQNSPWGYGWDAWSADFFAPAAPLLQAAPLAATRGNHENCARAGQGWWRLLAPQPLRAGQDCNDPAHDDMGDHSDPYAVSLGENAQLILLDLAAAGNKALTYDTPEYAHLQDVYRKYAALTEKARYNIAANHHPILAFTAKDGKDGAPSSLEPGNGAIQSAFSGINPWIIPANVQLLLSGHTHVWEQLSFRSPHPSQFVAGFSGTQEDVMPLPAKLIGYETPAAGAEVASFSSWVNGFGWMSMERKGAADWDVIVHAIDGHAVNHCTIRGKVSRCDVPQVQP